MSDDINYCTNTSITASKVYDDEAIVINTATGRYYDLEGAGADVWALLERGITVGEAAAEVVRLYDTDHPTAARDVEDFFRLLQADNLIVASNSESAAPGPTSNEISQPSRLPYVPPTVTTFTDMEDLLAADPPMPATYTPVWEPQQGAKGNV
jgi:hypothetical protein